jgi:hypothetical protein
VGFEWFGGETRERERERRERTGEREKEPVGVREG